MTILMNKYTGSGDDGDASDSDDDDDAVNCSNYSDDDDNHDGLILIRDDTCPGQGYCPID